MKKTCVLIFAVFMSVSAFSSPDKKQVKLRLQDSFTGSIDETTIYFDVGTSPAFVFPEDAQKEFDTSVAIPELYSFSSDHVPCYSNGYGLFTQSVVLPLGVRVPGGAYVFSASLISNFDSTTLFLLEDKTLGTFTDLRTQKDTVQIAASDTGMGRFYIHISYPPVISSVAAGCINNDGVIIITQDTTVTWTSINVYDAGMHLITIWPDVNGNVNFTGLQEELYNLLFVYGSYTTMKTIEVGGNKVSAHIIVSTDHFNIGDTISFMSETVNATQYQWNFGEGTIVYGVANPKYIYDTPGVYNVALRASNTYGCVGNDNVAITVSATTTTDVGSISGDKIQIISDNKNLMMYLNNLTGNSYSYEVYNVMGEMVTTGPLTSDETTIYLNNQSTGIYIVTVKSREGKSFSKKVFIGE